MAAPTIASALRRSLLIKIISKPQPSKEDVASVIELTASKVVEALQAQSMTVYMVEGNDIAFKQIYYSPTLWANDTKKEKKFKEMQEKLLQLKIPSGTGIVGKVIQTGEPLFFQNTESQAPMMTSMAKTTGFDVKSMLTVPLKTTLTLGAIQALNKEFSAGTNGEFTESDLKLLKEVAEYSSALIHRMIDPKFQLGPDDTARFISKLTDLPLVTKIEELEIEEKLVESTGDAIIRREGVFPYKSLAPGSVAVVMMNPLDYAKRESFTQTTDLAIDEVHVASATLFETPHQEVLQGLEGGEERRRRHRLRHQGDKRRLRGRRRGGRPEGGRPGERGLGPHHPAREPDRRGRLHLGRVRHPHRADGEGPPCPLPDRRPVPGEAAPAKAGLQRARHPPEDHVQPGHIREEAAPGRPHRLQEVHEEEHRHRPARRDRAYELWREGRDAHTRQAEVDASPDRARLLGGEPRKVPRVHPPALRDDPALRA